MRYTQKGEIRKSGPIFETNQKRKDQIMATSAVKYNFVTRNSQVYATSSLIKFWKEEPALEGYDFWHSTNGPNDSINADAWQIMTGLPFEYGAYLKNVQITVNWDD